MSGVGTQAGSRSRIPTTIIGWLFILVGVGTIVKDLLRAAGVLGDPAHFDHDDVYVLISGAWALAGGWLLLRGSAWGRWLILVWLAGHVVIGFLHGAEHGITHVVLLLVIG